MATEENNRKVCCHIRPWRKSFSEFYNSAERTRDGTIGQTWLLLGLNICITFKLSISIHITSSIARWGEKLSVWHFNDQLLFSVQPKDTVFTFDVAVKFEGLDFRAWNVLDLDINMGGYDIMIHLSWVCAYWRMRREMFTLTALPHDWAAESWELSTNNNSSQLLKCCWCHG